MAIMKILHGGRIRMAFDVPADPTSGTTRAAAEFWTKGDVGQLQTDGIVKSATAVNGAVFGPLYETRTEDVNPGLLTDECAGSGKVTMILDPAVVETDQYASGLKNWEENQSVYTNTSGKLTNVDGAF